MIENIYIKLSEKDFLAVDLTFFKITAVISTDSS